MKRIIMLALLLVLTGCEVGCKVGDWECDGSGCYTRNRD